MAERQVEVDRETAMLLPVNMREWVPEDDLVHFVIAAVESMNLSSFSVNRARHLSRCCGTVSDWQYASGSRHDLQVPPGERRGVSRGVSGSITPCRGDEVPERFIAMATNFQKHCLEIVFDE